MVHIVSISNYITFPSTQFTLYIKFALKDIFPWIMPSSVKRQKTDDWKFGMVNGDWRDQQRSGEVWPRRRPVLPSVFLLWLELLINWNVQVATVRIAIRYVTDQFLGCWMTVTMLYNLRTISLFVPISLSVFFWGYKIDGWQIAVWEVTGTLLLPEVRGHSCHTGGPHSSAEKLSAPVPAWDGSSGSIWQTENSFTGI